MAIEPDQLDDARALSPQSVTGSPGAAFRRRTSGSAGIRHRTRPADGEHSDTDVHVRDYLRVLSRRRWPAGTAFAIVMLLVIVHVLTAPRIYQATARVLIEAEKQNIVSFKEVVEQSQTSDSYYQTQYNLLLSRALAEKAMDNLGLWDHPDFGGERPGVKRTGSWRTALGHALETLISLTRNSAGEPAPVEPAERNESLRRSRAVDAYLRQLVVSPLRNSRLVDISFRSPDARLAAKLANAHAQAAIEQNLEFKFMASREASDWLRQRLEEEKTKVESSELAVQQFREQNDGISLEERQNIVAQKLADVSATVTRAKTARIEKEALYRQLEAIEQDQEKLDSFPAILSNTFIQQLKTQLSELQKQDAQLAEQLGERHPDRIKLASAIQLTRAKLQNEVSKVVQSLRNDYLAAQAQEQGLTAALEVQQREALSMNRKGIEGSVLKREADSNRQIYESLSQREKETGVSGELKVSNIRLVDPAATPQSPYSPNRQLSLIVGLMGGLFVAVGLAFFFEYLDDHIKLPDEINNHLGLTTLGLVPRVTQDVSGARPLIRDTGRPQLLEAFRAIRTNVLFSPEALVTRTILVTSTGPGEGKTSTSANLAVCIAQSGQRVLLIDGDLRRPTVHSVFDIEQEPGLSEMLVGDAHAQEVIYPSGVAGLWILPSGHTPSDPAELLASEPFKDFLTALHTQFDWVVIDSPPVMAVADALVVAHDISRVIFVVRAGVTTRREAKIAIAQLERMQATVIGAVLNGVDLDRHSYYYSGYDPREYASYYAPTS